MLLKYITKLRNNRGQRTTYFLSFKASKGVCPPSQKSLLVDLASKPLSNGR